MTIRVILTVAHTRKQIKTEVIMSQRYTFNSYCHEQSNETTTKHRLSW